MDEPNTSRSSTNRVIRGYSITIIVDGSKEELWIDGVKHDYIHTDAGYALYHSRFHQTLLEAAMEYVGYLPERGLKAPAQGE